MSCKIKWGLPHVDEGVTTMKREMKRRRISP
jgi:hypothetical protein